jgi:hypothetical protein
MFLAMFSPISFNSFGTPAGSNLGEHYQIQSSAADDGQKHPKHVEPTWNHKLFYIAHLVGYFHVYSHMSF